jgi:hypothetical protein
LQKSISTLNLAPVPAQDCPGYLAQTLCIIPERRVDPGGMAAGIQRLACFIAVCPSLVLDEELPEDH